MLNRLRACWPLVLLLIAAVLTLHAARLLQPALWFDDFEVLERSWTWAETHSSLWTPQNEHAMPLGRLTTWGMIGLTGRLTALSAVTGWHGPVALLLGLVPLYLFLRRELGQPLYGWLGVIFFGVSAAYQEAVVWFAASFSVLSLDTLLLALLAAQQWRQRGQPAALVGSVIAAGLAPCWFALGIVAGPLCVLYLWTREQGEPPRWGRRLLSLAPLLGTAAFLAVSWLCTAERILHLMRVDDRLSIRRTEADGKTVLVPLQVLTNTGRSLVDHVVLGAVGIAGVSCPPRLVPLPLSALLAAAVWWWRRAPCQRLLRLGAGAVVLNYLLIYVGRSHLEYEAMLLWSRYHLLSHFGLVLFLCGGLPRWLHATAGEPLTSRHWRQLAILIGVLCLLHLPRGILGSWREAPGQAEVLQQIEAVDAYCHDRRIAAAVARATLAPRVIPAAGDHVNGWNFLWGSPEPLPHSVEEVRQLLGPVAVNH